MCKVGIFGGTTEGRLLAEYCCQNQIPAFVSVVSGYGEELLPNMPCLNILTGAKEEAEIEELIRIKKTELVIDATHPYAVQITKNLEKACHETGCRYVRCVRETGETEGKGRITRVSNLEEAIEYLKGTRGNILLTTGSKETAPLTRLDRYQERVFLRALPLSEVFEKCKALGITGSHIICMQGPFSREMNEAMIRQLKISYLVTKEAGSRGGYQEKIDAAAACNIEAVVVGRPSPETGAGISQVKKLLKEYCVKKSARVSLVGVGMGGEGQLTRRAERAIAESDVVIGAKRMIDSVEYLAAGKEKQYLYLPEDIVGCLNENIGWSNAAVVFSGDTGFYSGAAGLIRRLEAIGADYQVIPGISSVSYLCAALGTSWEDACIASLHGREFDVVTALKSNRKLFLLMGGEHTVSWLCQLMTGQGFGEAEISVGERLSYSDEKITRGKAKELKNREFADLSVVYVEGGDNHG